MKLSINNQNQSLPVIPSQEIIFIDRGVYDYQSLVNGVKPGIAVVILDSKRDGIEQITYVLAQNSFTKVHIVSHGSPGCLYLGNSQLNLDNLNNYSQQLKQWFTYNNQQAEPQAMASQPETGSQKPPSPLSLPPSLPSSLSLLLYGCNVAAGDAGEEFIDKLHGITKADIAASTTAIGNAQKGGNWELDINRGKVNSLSAFSVETIVNYTGVLNTNFAPVLDNSKNLSFTTVDEDAAVPSGVVGNLVSQLVDLNPPAGELDNVTDTDTGAVTGIAITAADTTNGSWFYSIDNGSNWNPLENVSDNNARLLAADTDTRIYFLPNTNYNGTINDGITFRAWDTTTGSNGGIADTTTNGGSTAFSSDIETAAITVNPIKDAPTISNSILIINEGGIVTLSNANLSATDIDNDDTTLTFTVSNVTNGNFEVDGVAATSFTQQQITNNLVKFIHNGSENAPSYNVEVSDGDLTDSGSATVNFSNINDAPSFTGDATLAAVDEGVDTPAGETIANLFNGKFQDIDTEASLSGVAVVGNSVTNEGKWQYSTDSSTWNDIAATVNDTNAFALSENTLIRFLPGGSFNGTPPLLTVRALDDSYSGGFATTIDVTTNGGESAISASTNTISTTVNPVVGTIYVNSNATGDNNGSLWANAYTDLQSALAAANSGDQIWVAKGIYKPGATSDASFELKDNVAIYGGFAGTEANLSDRNITEIKNNETILSGDNTSYNVVKLSDTATTILDGFIIQEGNSNDDGGGIWNRGNLTLENIVVRNNQAADDGGGIRNDGNLTLINSTVAGNTALSGSSQTSGGGGLINTTAATVNIINSTFSGNTALNGGGIRNDGTLNLINSTLSGNTALQSGGGLVNTLNQSAPNNPAAGGNATISNSTITNNTAASQPGGGIANVGVLTVSNSIIAGNAGNDDISNQFTVTLGIPFTFTGITNSNGNNLIGNGEGTSFTNGANGDIVGDSTNPIDAKLGTLQDNGGLTQTHALLNGSPAVNAGSNSSIAEDTFDLDGDSNTTDLPFEQRGVGFERIIDSTV
ncbi:MAG: DUF4347 domain-containing protein, partial [Rivularia sp. (in: cyanobacteria)]